MASATSVEETAVKLQVTGAAQSTRPFAPFAAAAVPFAGTLGS